ncbi:haloacid dehalogenase [Streptomyces ruber]|uniref:Haloacid dehalogenase n=2 Tax=Streptomyces TaxID=1883 RepID=A0A918EPF1_9ACTN|nr:haloacid dehalogenase-like hydrolase [Streptomyces ruber]GGQ47980.1 haloacid dehalogenase [Streptomyces ruber]
MTGTGENGRGGDGGRTGDCGDVLAVDFDGVVADALKECALVTWLGGRGLDPSLSGAEQLERVPDEFVERFRRVRDYARLLDHFVVAHLPGAGAVDSQAAFDALFSGLDAAFVRGFTTAAGAAREWLRTGEPDFWLDLHTLYPGMAGLLRRCGGRVVVVTAKDEGSVRAILARHGVEHTVREVFGECRHKAGAVLDVSARWGVPVERITFIDDNLANVREVARTGARARWALWGYATPEHRAEADRHAVPALHLSEVRHLAPVTV